MAKRKEVVSDEVGVDADFEVDLSLDPEHRPLVGRDIEMFRARHHLSHLKTACALALLSVGVYKISCSAGVMPVSREVLIRLYNRYPNFAPWDSVVSPAQAFRLLYGDVFDRWKGTPSEGDAKVALYGRFAALFGRAWCNSYRWIERGGKAKSDVSEILSKIAQIPQPREVLEGIARQVLALRGVDLDRSYPLPDISGVELPVPRARGRRRAVPQEGVSQSAEQAAGAKPKPGAKRGRKPDASPRTTGRRAQGK